MLPELMDGKTAETLTDITDALLALGPAKSCMLSLSNSWFLCLLSCQQQPRELKNYLRSTIGQERLNSVMLLNIHDKHADEINLCDVARALSENRRSVFGEF